MSWPWTSVRGSAYPGGCGGAEPAPELQQELRNKEKEQVEDLAREAPA